MMVILRQRCMLPAGIVNLAAPLKWTRRIPACHSRITHTQWERRALSGKGTMSEACEAVTLVPIPLVLLVGEGCPKDDGRPDSVSSCRSGRSSESQKPSPSPAVQVGLGTGQWAMGTA